VTLLLRNAGRLCNYASYILASVGCVPNDISNDIRNDMSNLIKPRVCHCMYSYDVIEYVIGGYVIGYVIGIMSLPCSLIKTSSLSLYVLVCH
jgi:hypothetical protein